MIITLFVDMIIWKFMMDQAQIRTKRLDYVALDPMS